MLILATAVADDAILRQRDVLHQAFPVRAPAMVAGLHGGDLTGGRGLALIDPRSKRRDWLIASRSDGRRSPAPFADVSSARRILFERGRRS